MQSTSKKLGDAPHSLSDRKEDIVAIQPGEANHPSIQLYTVQAAPPAAYVYVIVIIIPIN